jgi:hypothetical protein
VGCDGDKENSHTGFGMSVFKQHEEKSNSGHD